MMLTVGDLRVAYGGRPILSLPDLVAHAGQVLMILGPNGSGKSTLLKALAGILRSDGRIHLNGKPIQGGDLGYMPQDSAVLSALTVLETVLLGQLGRLGARVRPEDLAQAEQVLTRLNIAHLASCRLTDLSGGQRQLVFLAQTLIKQPKVLLLDEPISALDVRHQLDVLALVRTLTQERNLVSLVVLHDVTAAARFADQLLLLRDGRPWHIGPPREVLTPLALADLYDVEAEILTDSAGHHVIVPQRSLPDRGRRR